MRLLQWLVQNGDKLCCSNHSPTLIVATIETSEDKGTHSFRHTLKGRAGERIELTRNGAQPRAPKLHIKGKDGIYDRTYSFEYG